MLGAVRDVENHNEARAVTSRAYTIGIVEDDEDMRAYIEGIVLEAEGLDVVFSVGYVAEAITAQKKLQTDICLVDLQLPDGTGVDFIKSLDLSVSKALILTVLGDKTSVMLALEAGANGYLLKDTPPRQIIRDLRATLSGANPISPQAATHLLQLLKKPETSTSVTETEKPVLTEREIDVLTLFAKGLSYKETATSLGIKPNTVSDYVKIIYRKLSVHSRNEAIFEAMQSGLIKL